MKAFFISIPHSGEQVPREASWLAELPEPILMCDVDRYVDRLYRPVIDSLGLPSVVTPWHRYAVDLNRLPEDVDADSVEGSSNASGKFTTGLHWVKTTTGHKLMPAPMPKDVHALLIIKYFQPFHAEVRELYSKFFSQGAKRVFHLDAHSMPSKGTSAHRDPGETRAEIVVSDFNGVSCEAWYRDLVIESYKQAGFQVKVNWPYIGGRVTQTYGHPNKGQNAIQVELRRDLYMNEETKRLKESEAKAVSEKIKSAIASINQGLPEQNQ